MSAHVSLESRERVLKPCRCSDHGVLACCLPEPRGAELRDPLLRLEIDVSQAEPVTEACVPFQVVLRAPVEVAVQRHPFRGCALQLAETCTQERQPVCVVHPAVISNAIFRCAPVLGDVDRIRTPYRL